jgi:hypothetical protein
MSTARQQPDADPRIVDQMLAEVVERARQGQPIQTSLEAERIIRWLDRRNPAALQAWADSYLGTLMTDILRRMLQSTRSVARAHRGEAAFAAYRRTGEMVTTMDALYQTPDGWKRLRDMRKPDWAHVLRQRSQMARASLLEVEFAKRIIAKLPNDEVTTGEVMQLDEIEQALDQAEQAASKVLNRKK